MPEHSYFLRITPYGTMSFEDITGVLQELDIQKYFICYEQASRPHYHLCLWSPRSVENLRYRIKQCIEGEVYLSGKAIEDKVRAIAYCMKDGNYIEQNIDINDWLLAKQLTFKKTTYEQEYNELLSDTTHPIEWIATKLIDLHVKYNKKIYRQHLKATMELIQCKRCGRYRDNLVKYIIEEY